MFDFYNLEKKSIRQALCHNWVSAITTNKEILRQIPSDVNTLNRLAKAQIELGQLDDAELTLKTILSLDNYNSIAKINLEKLRTTLKPLSPITSTNNTNRNICFIEEPGKTIVVQLTNLGDPNIINQLSVGLEVFFKLAGRKIKITNSEQQYLGSLPDDLCLSLVHCLRLGNKYQILIKSVNCRSITIFIREIKKSARLKGMDSFPKTKKSNPTLRPHKLSETPLEIFDSKNDIDEDI